MAADASRKLRDQLQELLAGGSAHLTFEDAIADLPPKLRGAKPPGQPHTAWRILEHMRIAQRDILEFSRNAAHRSPKWPDEYWPPADAPATPKQWDQSVRSFRSDLKAMQDLVADESSDLLAPIPGGNGKTVFREAMLLADHNAYHLGQLVLIRRLLKAWP